MAINENKFVLYPELEPDLEPEFEYFISGTGMDTGSGTLRIIKHWFSYFHFFPVQRSGVNDAE